MGLLLEPGCQAFPLIVVQLIFIGVNIAMAAYHAYLIGHNAKIYHGLWSAFYLISVAIAFWLTGEWLLIPILLILRKVVFDISLNLFRAKWWDYVSPFTSSILDGINNRLFSSAKVMYGVYVAIWLGLNILYYIT